MTAVHGVWLMVACAVLGGCGGAPDGARPDTSYGEGWKDDPWAIEGRTYLEGTLAVAQFEATMLRLTAEPGLCSGDPSEARATSGVLPRIREALWFKCRPLDYEAVSAMAARDKGPSERTAHYAALRAEAEAGIADEMEALNNSVARVSSELDAQFFDLAARQVMYHREVLGTGERYMDAATNGDEARRAVSYTYALINVASVVNETSLTTHYLASYRWSTRPCPVNFAAMAADARAALAAARQGLENATWLAAHPISGARDAVADLNETSEAFIELRWWPALVSNSYRVDWTARVFWDSDGDSGLSRDEVYQEWRASFERPISLVQEAALEEHSNVLRNPVPWNQSQESAILILEAAMLARPLVPVYCDAYPPTNPP